MPSLFFLVFFLLFSGSIFFWTGVIWSLSKSSKSDIQKIFSCKNNTTLLLYLYQIFMILLVHFFLHFFFTFMENLFKKYPISERVTKRAHRSLRVKQAVQGNQNSEHCEQLLSIYVQISSSFKPPCGASQLIGLNHALESIDMCITLFALPGHQVF